MSAEAAIDELLDLVPELRGDRTVTELAGGLTNTNYKVVTAAGAFVVRVSSKDAGLLAIDRENEYLNSVAAADAGVGAPVIGYLPERSLLVLGFIEGETQSAEDLRRGDKLAMAADACRGCTARAASATTSTCSTSSGGTWRSSRSAASGCPTATSSSSRRCARSSGRWPSATRARCPATTTCWPRTSSTPAARSRLIDYEYSGNNDACFELGNVWSESNLSLDQLEELIGHYYGAPLRNKVARARLWGLMSKYGWTLWARSRTASPTSTSTSGSGAWRSTTGPCSSSTAPTSTGCSTTSSAATEGEGRPRAASQPGADLCARLEPGLRLRRPGGRSPREFSQSSVQSRLTCRQTRSAASTSSATSCTTRTART